MTAEERAREMRRQSHERLAEILKEAQREAIRVQAFDEVLGEDTLEGSIARPFLAFSESHPARALPPPSEDSAEPSSPSPSTSPPPRTKKTVAGSERLKELASALKNLGFKTGQVAKAIREIPEEDIEDEPFEDLVKKALSLLGKKNGKSTPPTKKRRVVARKKVAVKKKKVAAKKKPEKKAKRQRTSSSGVSVKERIKMVLERHGAAWLTSRDIIDLAMQEFKDRIAYQNVVNAIALEKKRPDTWLRVYSQGRGKRAWYSLHPRSGGTAPSVPEGALARNKG